MNRDITKGVGPLTAIHRFLWAALVVSLPFTDLILFERSTGSFAHGRPTDYIITLTWLALIPEVFKGRFRPFLSDWPVRLLLLFVAINSASVLLSAKAAPLIWVGKSPWSVSFRSLSTLLLGVSIAFLTLVFVRTWRDFRKALTYYFVGFVLSGLAGLIETVTYYSGSSWTQSILDAIHSIGQAWYWEYGFRLRLLSFEPSMAADYLLCVIPLFAFGAYYWRSKLWSAVNSALSVVMMLATVSLGSVIGLAGELAAAFILLRRRFLATAAVLILLPLLIFTAFDQKPLTAITDRIPGLLDFGEFSEDGSARTRAAQLQIAFHTFLDHPFLGVGIGNPVFYSMESLPQWVKGDRFASVLVMEREDPEIMMTVNNLPVKILSETGIVGGVVFLLFLLSLFRECYKGYSEPAEPWKKAVAVSVLIAMVGQCVHFLTLSSLQFRYWFFLWGLAICLKRLMPQSDALLLTRSRIPSRLSAFVAAENGRKVMTPHAARVRHI